MCITWEKSSLRKWLNGTFYRNSFSSSEKALILTTMISDSQESSVADQVFLLSINEAYTYFKTDTARKCEPTEWAYENGAAKTKEGYCWWWLRDCIYEKGVASNVSCKGIIGRSIVQMNNEKHCVRPAMWISLEP